MENIIGKAKSYLEEKGIDTSNMTMEEIIAKYQDLINEEETKEDLAEEVVEKEEEIVEDDIEEAEDKTDLETLLEQNQDIIDSLNDEQTEFVEKLIDLIGE